MSGQKYADALLPPPPPPPPPHHKNTRTTHGVYTHSSSSPALPDLSEQVDLAMQEAVTCMTA